MEMSPYRRNSKRKNRPCGSVCSRQGSKKSSSERSPPGDALLLRKGGGFYAEFLAPLEGSEYDRDGRRMATKEVGGVSSQLLRYIDSFCSHPGRVALGEENGCAKRCCAEPTSAKDSGARKSNGDA